MSTSRPSKSNRSPWIATLSVFLTTRVQRALVSVCRGFVMHVQSPVSARCETDAVVLGVPSAVHYFDLAEFLVPRPARARRRVRGVSRIGNASTPHVGTASQAAVCGVRRRVRGPEGQTDLLEALQGPSLYARLHFGGVAGEAAPEVRAPPSSVRFLLAVSCRV